MAAKAQGPKPKPEMMVTPTVRLVRPLGKGGMGSVWVAEHLALEAEVAVKFLLPEMLELDKANPLERFKREAKAAAQVKHPHVVQMLDQGVMDDDTPYLVMELLEGESLAERFVRAGKMAPSEVTRLVSQVARALAAAHARHIVHRDIKPGNIFLVEAGGPLFCKVLDFGIAKRTAGQVDESNTATGVLMGVPHYLSPERLHGKQTDHQADLWALAAVAYRALLGKPPFEGETWTVLGMRICLGAHTAPSELDPTLEPALDAWFRKAFAVDPQDRFASAAALGETFQAALEGREPEGVPAPWAPKAPTSAAEAAPPEPDSGSVSPPAAVAPPEPDSADFPSPAASASATASTTLELPSPVLVAGPAPLERATDTVTAVLGPPRKDKRRALLFVGAALATVAFGTGVYYLVNAGDHARPAAAASDADSAVPAVSTADTTASLLESAPEPTSATAAPDAEAEPDSGAPLASTAPSSSSAPPSATNGASSTRHHAEAEPEAGTPLASSAPPSSSAAPSATNGASSTRHPPSARPTPHDPNQLEPEPEPDTPAWW